MIFDYTEKGNYRGEIEKYIYYEKNGNNIAFAEKISENWYFYWIDYDGREDLSNIKWLTNSNLLEQFISFPKDITQYILWQLQNWGLISRA